MRWFQSAVGAGPSFALARCELYSSVDSSPLSVLAMTVEYSDGSSIDTIMTEQLPLR